MSHIVQEVMNPDFLRFHVPLHKWTCEIQIPVIEAGAHPFQRYPLVKRSWMVLLCWVKFNCKSMLTQAQGVVRSLHQVKLNLKKGINCKSVSGQHTLHFQACSHILDDADFKSILVSLCLLDPRWRLSEMSQVIWKPDRQSILLPNLVWCIIVMEVFKTFKIQDLKWWIPSYSYHDVSLITLVPL